MQNKFFKIINLLRGKDDSEILYVNEYFDYDKIDKSKRKREDLVKTMEKGCKILEELGVKYWLGRGSVLGFHRDNDFLPSDIDIDIEILGDKDMYKIIKKLPFEPIYVSIYKGNFQQFALLDLETNVVFDIWCYNKTKDKLIIRNYFGFFWLPENKIKNLKSFDFEGHNYPIPDPDWYCEFWYGDNWRIPKKYGKDWSIDYRKDCKGFTYLGIKQIVQNNYF